ncbi:MAG: envelope fusion protein [Candidatus Thiodiazotropha taylori]|nr:envelope fusion protein [Candidatus Thiodiazotropha taylori]MCW4336225.1 envelope fusion protein [Candidatus Thiodiazotropha endolucinida]
MEKFDTPRSPEYKLALERLGREINSLKLSHINLEAKFSSYKMLSPRKRRSLLPFMTPVLHLLFGTLSSADVGALRRNVARLAKNQADITHVLEESLSVINASRISIDRNRQTINDIIDSLTDMDVKFANITEALQLNLIELSQFIRLYVQLDLVVEELKRFSLKGLFLLEHFKVQLGFLSLSRLSTEIIDPFQLTNILKGIAMRLPPTLKLPYDSDKGLWPYYKSLSVSTFLDDDRMIIVIILPLVQYDHQFEIYKVINLGMPLLNGSIATSDTHAMVARYDLEAAGIAINIPRTKYVLLDSQQLGECSKPVFGTCDLKSAIFPVNLSNKCILALFLESPEKVAKFCKRVVMPNTYVPMAVYLTDGLWVIVSQKTLRFAVTCEESTPVLDTIITKPPLDVISLKKMCRAENDYLSLMPFYTSETTEEITDGLVTMIKSNLNLTSMEIWKPFLQNITHFKHTQIPNKLKALPSIPMDTLIESLHGLRSMEPDPPESFPGWGYALVAFVSAIVIGLSIFLYCKYKQRLMSLCQVRRRGGDSADATGNDQGYVLVSTTSKGDGSTRPAMNTPSAPAAKEEIIELQEMKKLYPTFHLVPDHK